jgi:lipopolysaccharide/colanic/teichoic acid biosynthesis glycosyltransferase/glycosyltransferase involved in cell wall biosynthesis
MATAGVQVAGGPLRILFLTQYYPPEVGAAPTRAAHFARALARAGHRVTVVTGLPNHPSGILQPGFRPGDTETGDGITVRRTWLVATPRKSARNRLLNHLSFACSSAGAAARLGPADLVLVTIPPLFVGITAALAARKHRAPLIVDVRDDWPRAALALGEMHRGLVASILGAQASWIYMQAARVIGVTPGMLRSFSARGIDAGRQVLITNGADTEVFRPGTIPVEAGPERLPVWRRPGEFLVLYAGTHGLIHGMEVILDAAEILRERTTAATGGPENRREGSPGDGPGAVTAPAAAASADRPAAPPLPVRFLLVGDGVAKPGLMAAAQARGLESVEFYPSQPPALLAHTIEACDLCLATTRDHPFSGETIPVKIFDCLAAGKPVVGAVRGDAAAVLRDSGGGVVVAPGDGAALAQAILDLAADAGRRATMGAAGARFVEARYSRLVLGETLAATCAEVVRLARGRVVRAVPSGFHAFGKRAFDLLVSGLGLVLLSPIFLLIAILVKRSSPGPAFFRQRRPGRGSREFIMLKFRTMRTGTPDLASHLVGSANDFVTPVGKWLRRTSLDELPQLINVWKGEMGLVGPRPALFNQDDLIAQRVARGIDALRPGVTGWAQINGRDDIPLDLKVRYDAEYLERISPALDLAILIRTFTAVFTGRGAN